MTAVNDTERCLMTTTPCHQRSAVPRACVTVRRCRSWRTELEGGVCVLVSMSVDCPNVKSTGGCVRAETFASHFCLEPRGATGCRLTHFSHADLR